jgi:hypothetical protein
MNPQRRRLPRFYRRPTEMKVILSFQFRIADAVQWFNPLPLA